MDFRDYGQDVELVKQFLKDFTTLDDDGQIQSKYGPRLELLANREAVHLLIDVADVEQFNHDLANEIFQNTVRYKKIFLDALDEILPSYKTKEATFKDPMDVFVEQRLSNAERHGRTNQAPTTGSASQTGTNQPGRRTDIDGIYPPDLIRQTEVSFKPATLMSTPIRKVLAAQIGKLITIRGIVTRATDVKPRVTIVTYTCDQCGCESFQPVQDAQDFTPLFECTSAPCKANKSFGRIMMQTRGSKFIKSQEVKLQEHSDQVPTGHIPRTITVMLFGEMTRQCSPGDHVSISGNYLAIERGGYRMRNTGMTSDTYFEAHYITQMNKTEDDEISIDPLSLEEAEELIRGEENFLSRLSSSIAPEIHGHENLKKALLLLLVGGVDKNQDGMKIRGNVNICLMGDPGVAKSQLLSFIDRLATRSQYTTGRGSSGVGLTAAVLKDPITNELVLEGGALVLADQGICCIDEFDKMMDGDRTAIHEVMEQQTVSIAKAGIMTTLNARVSILAAANPAWGRYQDEKSIADNLQLPPALLSRFDLLWLIRDQPEKAKDLDLAQHILHTHANPNQEPQNDYAPLDMKTLRRYINLCKTKNPIIPQSLGEKLVSIYLGIRTKKRTYQKADSLFTSPRSLLAILRLSTALARLRLAEVVEEADIDAAVDLYSCSKDSIEKVGKGGKTKSTAQTIYDILKEMREELLSESLPTCEIEDRASHRGISKEEVKWALERLNNFDTIQYNGDEVIMINLPEHVD